MTDLSLTIAPKSDQLNADDLIGGPMTVRVTRVSACPDSAEQPIAVFFDGDNGKPYKPCKIMRRVMVQVWGKDGTQYAGRSMTLYRDPKVLFGGLAVGGIRISHMSNINSDVTMALTATRGNKKPFTVHPLVASDHTWDDATDPLNEPNGTKWLANLEAALLQAADLDQVAAVRGHESVVKALAGAPAKIKSRINELLTAATDRTAHVIQNDPTLGGDPTDQPSRAA